MPGSDFLDLSDLFEHVADLGYAAGAAGEFSLAAGQYRATYDTLYGIYRDVERERQRVETSGLAVVPRSVSPVINGVTIASVVTQRAVVSGGTSLALRLTFLQAQLAHILNQMSETYSSTVAADTRSADNLGRAAR